MNKENLVIINNEKLFKDETGFYCDNLNLKVVPEELNKHFDVNYIMNNYVKIQNEMDKNKLPTKESMIRQISNIINN